MDADSPSALVLYHYMHPDDVVSAVIFTELCTGLSERGWRVTASSCNRAWNDDSANYPREEALGKVALRRVWRPALRQSSSFGRMANAAWMVAAWSLLALRPGARYDVLIVGTDPVLSPAVALAWRLFRPKVKIAHWCFDLYPEAAISAGLMKKRSISARFFRFLMRHSYRRCDLIADLGSCMRKLLQRYGASARVETIPPWALIEPAQPVSPDAREREILFGGASLGLLYSGSFGRAHSWEGIPELAQSIAPAGCRIAFSVRGNAVDDLRRSIDSSGADVTFAPFASAEDAEKRLSAADVHIVSLHEEWTGTVVPSKFFSALAIGRPVLFIGSSESSIAGAIREFGVGWVLNEASREQVQQALTRLAICPSEKAALFNHCQQVYWDNFSRHSSLGRWDGALKAILNTR